MPTILIVDDEADNRLLLRQILEYGGYSTLEAANGNEALELLRQRNTDAVIVDLHMPAMSGAELMKAVRSDPSLRNLRALLYTATPENRAVRDFMQIYDIAYTIPKPSEPQNVLEIVARSLG